MKTSKLGQAKIEKIPCRVERALIPPSSHFSTCSAAGRNRGRGVKSFTLTSQYGSEILIGCRDRLDIEIFDEYL